MRLCKECKQYKPSNEFFTKRCRTCKSCKRLTPVSREKFIKIKKRIEDEGFSLLSRDYYNSYDKLSMLCPEGHEIKVSYNAWTQRKGNACRKCATRQVISRQVLSNDFIASELAKEGFELLSGYERSSIPFKYRCPEGHEHEMTWAHWQRGVRCAYCAGTSRLKYTAIKKEIEKEGYRLLEDFYVNARTPMEVMCPNGHAYKVSWSNWLNGRRCHTCANRITKEGVEKYLNSNNSTFKCNSVHYPKLGKTIITLTCNNGHQFDTVMGNIRNSIRCPVCDASSSIAQKELALLLDSWGFKVIMDDREIIKPLQLDIVLPEKKIAIEYNGLYWHSEQGGKKDKTYHVNKTVLAKSNGYRLIMIMEDEYKHSFDIVVSRLKHILGIPDGFRIHGRDCLVKQITSNEASKFLSKYHIQGSGKSRIKLGAFFEDYLVAVMTFSKGNIAKKQSPTRALEWELDRFCSHPDFCIPGVASKLLTYFERNYEWESIVSFADKRWSVGNVYEKLGFFIDHETKPNYWYINFSEIKRVHRFSLRKNKNDDPNLTEWENRKLQGYDRIWDCGSIKYLKVRD